MKSATLALALSFLTLALAPSRAALPDQVLDEINLARTNPREYARVLEAQMPASAGCDVAEAVRFLENAHPIRPLTHEEGLTLSAKMLVSDQGPRGATGHNGSGWGNTPWSRMTHFGQWLGCAAENIQYGHTNARAIVCALIVDSHVPGRGHRKNIFNPNYAVAGVACGPHAVFREMCVIDFAGGFVSRGGALAGL